MSYAGSYPRQALDRLEVQMVTTGPAVRLELGDAADARINGDGQSIVFIVDSLGHEQPHEQPVEGQAFLQENLTFIVSISAPDFDAVRSLKNRLLRALDETFSDNGYVTPVRGGKVKRPGLDSKGFTISLPVTLFFPVLREEYIQGHIEAVNQAGSVTDVLGVNAEAAP